MRPGPSTCRSGTCGNSSSPRPRSPPAGASCWRRRAWRPATSSRCCWRGRSAATCPRPTRSGSAWCRRSAGRAWSARGTSRARGPRRRCCRGASGPAGGRCRGGGGMSSCPTAPISTTASSRNSPSPAEAPVLVIACGALGAHLREIITRRGWRAELRCLPALLHNRPEKITIAAERLARAGVARGQRVAVAYADCGTYGALDEVCTRLGLRRLPGLHCYDVLAGPERIRAEFEAEPGTYVLTDFLVRSFDKTVLAELGLD